LKAQPINDRASQLYGSLQALSARTDATNQKILEAAGNRLDAVQKEMAALAPQVLTQHGAEDEYKSLVLEARQLQVVIGQCNRFS